MTTLWSFCLISSNSHPRMRKGGQLKPQTERMNRQKAQKKLVKKTTHPLERKAIKRDIDLTSLVVLCTFTGMRMEGEKLKLTISFCLANMDLLWRTDYAHTSISWIWWGYLTNLCGLQLLSKANGGDFNAEHIRLWVIRSQFLQRQQPQARWGDSWSGNDKIDIFCAASHTLVWQGHHRPSHRQVSIVNVNFCRPWHMISIHFSSLHMLKCGTLLSMAISSLQDYLLF